MPTLECNELFEGCEAVVNADSTEEVLNEAAAHARDAHGLETLDDDTVEAVKAAITD